MDPPELIAMAAGSPGALIEHRQRWSQLPESLANRLEQADRANGRFVLARDLSESLDGEQQLWLIEWLQQSLWRAAQSERPKTP